MADAEQLLEQTREQGLRELEAFVRIPSVSSQPDRAEDVRRAAGHLAEQYQRIGLENGEVLETTGHPVVYADWLRAPGKPTVLLYGHYDVQPVDPSISGRRRHSSRAGRTDSSSVVAPPMTRARSRSTGRRSRRC